MIKKTTAILAALCLSATGALAAGGFEMNVAGLEDGAILDSKFAAKGGPRNCDGDNVAPAVTWSKAPEGTQSFALLMHDQTGAHGMGVTHLVAYGIDGTATEMPEGGFANGADGFIGGKNRIGQAGWFGPCPDVGDVPHHYVFTLIATDLAPDALEPGLNREGLLAALEGHALAATGFVVRYARN